MKRDAPALFVAFVFLGAVLPGLCAASGPVPRPAVPKDAELVSVSGEGWVRFREQEGWLDAFREQILTAGDLLRTGEYGRMGVLFADGIQIRVSRKTTLAIRETPAAGGKKSTVLGLDVGEVWSRSQALPEGLRIETPAATAAIRGTDWDLNVDETGRSHLTVLAGAVSFFNDYGSLVVEAGQQAVAEPGKAPVKSFLVRPRERVQWVFSYPMNIADLVFFHSHRRQVVLKALPAARKAVEENPADDGARLFLAGLLFDLREKDQSLRLFEELLARDPKNARALAFRGLLALDRGDVETAKTCFDRALENQSGGSTVEALLGRVGVALHEGRVAEAASLLREVENAGKRPQVGVVSAVFDAFLGDFTKAVETASGYESLYPTDERFPILLASFYTVLDEAGKAREAVRRALALYPDSSQGYGVLAGLEHLEGKGKEAEAAYRKAIELDPTNAVARNGLALLQMERGEYEEAREQLSETVARAPENPMGWANRGFLFTLIEKLADARSDYQEALDRDPTHYVTLSGLGLVALKEGRTEEAIQSFLKSSLLEPGFSQPHSFLAVAYYQLGQVDRALGELAVASRLDPKDPFPHLIAYLIYQDTYRPFEAIEEARRVLELLPYLKSVEEIENTKVGLSNLGSALLGFGLSEWSESYAQESFDPHNASSHFQASRRYNDNHYVAVSELVQGLLLDPLANSRSARYLDIIRKPRWDASLSGTWGDEDGGFSQQYSGIIQGYTRKLWETACSLAVQGYDKQGSVENGDSDGVSLALGLGIKPDYRNSLNVGFTAGRDESGQPGSGPELDPDDRLKTENLSADLGYRHRFGPKNNVIARAAYDRWILKSRNPAPFGTGLTDIQASFLYAGFGIQETRRFFQQGVYDVSALVPPDQGGITLATDSTGTFAETPGAVLLPGSFPSFVDTDLRRYEKSDQETFLLQGRQLVNLGERHEFTWGAEYIPLKVRSKRVTNVFVPQDTIYFFEEPILDPEVYGWQFDLVSPVEVTERSTDEGRFITAYVDDRWKVADWLLLEGAVFFESFYDDENEDNRAYPRVGAAVRLLKNHILRVGYLHWLEKVSSGTLAPVAVAGLVVDNSLGLQGSRLYDYQVRLESRWTSRLFTVFGGERVELKDAALAGGLPKREIDSNRAMAAVNAIVTKQLGFFLRYLYSDAEGSGGAFDGLSVPGVPDHVASGGVVWISPLYVKVMLTETYIGEQYTDYSNEEKLSSFWLTSLSASWEPFQKHGFIGLSVNNLFNEGDPAPGRSAYVTLEYRF